VSEWLLILATTILVNNFVLVHFLGLCPFMGVSGKLDMAIGMGLATTFVLTLSSVVSYSVNTWILVPLEIEYLRLIVFILIIAGLVQFTELFVRRTSPWLHQVLGIFLPLITTNCAVLGVALLSLRENTDLLSATIYGMGAALGFTLVLVLFSAMRERIDQADVPVPFKGAAVAMISAGFMSLAFMGFGGFT
jgi:electron transport complex protein RnfA